MVAILAGLSFIMGPVQLLKLYGIPYAVSCFYISICLVQLTEHVSIVWNSDLQSLCWTWNSTFNFFDKTWNLNWLQIFVMWLDLVTYLHHHGHDEKLPWYRGKVWIWHISLNPTFPWLTNLIFIYFIIRLLNYLLNLLKQEWSYLRGGLTTLDRDYGWVNNIHHDIGTHVIHHLYPQIPHYHLVEAVSFNFAETHNLFHTCY